jgi:acyl-coenzyme A synthetase/AMP-(fatty) acid ligase
LPQVNELRMSNNSFRPSGVEAAIQYVLSKNTTDELWQLADTRCIGDAIRYQAERRKGETAIVGSRFDPLSYSDLQNQIDEIAKRLREAGYDQNSRIAIALPTGPLLALAIVAIACAAIAVPLDPKLTVPELERRLSLLRPSAMLLMRGSSSPARTVADRHGLAIIEAGLAKVGNLALDLEAKKIGSAAPVDKPDPHAPAFILQSSGTTADPKLIPVSHRNMLAAAARLKAWFLLTPQDRCLCVSPVYYAQGLKVTLFGSLLTGGSAAFPSDASLLDISEWLDGLKPTWYSAGPTLHLAMSEKAKSLPNAKSVHSLRFILSSGASLPSNVREELQAALGVPVLEHYGASETGQIAANLPPPGPSKPGTCGIPWPETVMIVGEDGSRLPRGQQGQILVGGPTVTAGYLGAPDLNRTGFVDGWFRTGDIGSVDEEGFLTIHGRLVEVINRAGEKIAPLEIDRALMRHPEVAEAAAFATPHPRLGEDVGAAVVLYPGSAATPAELREFIATQLAPFKVPRRILVLDQLPKGTSGKVQRRRLSEVAKELLRRPS